MAKCTGVRCPMQYGYNVEECNQTDCPYRTEPVTNADKIRAMSDEELVNVLREFATKPMQGSFLKWLKQPAEVDNG